MGNKSWELYSTQLLTHHANHPFFGTRNGHNTDTIAQVLEQGAPSFGYLSATWTNGALLAARVIRADESGRERYEGNALL